MTKWADYCITAVRYNNTHTQILKVNACEDRGDGLGREKDLPRKKFMSELANKKTFITIYRENQGEFKKGRPIKLVIVDSIEYIRTDNDYKAADALDNVPEF